MKKNLSRRDFLKLSGALSAGLIGSPYLKLFPPGQADASGKKNVLIIVFDAFSARHISAYGYDRETTPNISRLAERAVVYHNHHAGGNFTTPGTASLLTGSLPWTHRAFGFYRTVTETLADKSMFHVFDDYYTIAYSHNPLVVRLLDQFSAGLDNFIPLEKFLLSNDGIVDDIFSQDGDIASVSWARTIKKEEGYSYSLFFSNIYKQYWANKLESLKPMFPRGLPNIRGDNYFTLEMVMDWLRLEINKFPQPFMGYFHFMPPHSPYATQIEFYNRFLNDRFEPILKPEDIFSEGASFDLMLKRRQQYDEFILYADREFGKLFDRLEEIGMLENTWVVLTSDHGEVFERGIIGHVTPVLYEPIIRVPLMIFEPGRKTRLDVHSRTSAVDLLPTLLHLTGGTPPEWSDGIVIPPFSETDMSSSRDIYVMQAKNTESDSPLTQATVTIIRDNYKLTYFIGYEELGGDERIELYDIAADPEELNNIYSPGLEIGKAMFEELKAKIAEVNAPYL